MANTPLKMLSQSFHFTVKELKFGSFAMLQKIIEVFVVIIFECSSIIMVTDEFDGTITGENFTDLREKFPIQFELLGNLLNLA